MAQNDGTVLFEDARLIFLNFSGVERQYNREGDRNFCVLLDEDTADVMSRDGWNIKALKPREEGDEPQPYIEVAVAYKVRPPQITMIGDRTGRRTRIGENLVMLLDDSDIATVDLIIRPYKWEVNGKTGIKAYLQTMYVTIEENPLDEKYAVSHPEEDGTV